LECFFYHTGELLSLETSLRDFCNASTPTAGRVGFFGVSRLPWIAHGRGYASVTHRLCRAITTCARGKEARAAVL